MASTIDQMARVGARAPRDFLQDVQRSACLVAIWRAARAAARTSLVWSEHSRDRRPGWWPMVEFSPYCAIWRPPARSGAPVSDARPCGCRSPTTTGSRSAQPSLSASSLPGAAIEHSGEDEDEDEAGLRRLRSAQRPARPVVTRDRARLGDGRAYCRRQPRFNAGGVDAAHRPQSLVADSIISSRAARRPTR